MAKHLPFFKFDATEYLTGKIQFCDMETQGVFTNLCARLWSENLVLKNDRFLAKKINVSQSTLERCLTDLKELEIISENDGFLSVDFLTRQIKERSKFIEKCSKAGQKSASVRNVPPTKQKAESRKKKEEKEINKENSDGENPGENPIHPEQPAAPEQPPIKSRTFAKSVPDIVAAFPRKSHYDESIRSVIATLDKLVESKFCVNYETAEVYLLDRVLEYGKAVEQWPVKERSYLPKCSTWMEAGQYRDDPETWKKGQPEEENNGGWNPDNDYRYQ